MASEDAATPEAALISAPLPATCLQDEYRGNVNPNFLTGIDALHKRYASLRRVRGDGNCFFRGVIFALCEIARTDASLHTRLLQRIRDSKRELVALGYSEVAIDTFWETFVDYLAAMDTRSQDELVQDFQTEGGESEYLVWYARLLTAGHLKANAERFQPFVEGLFPGLTVEAFCGAEVEPMGKECDQPQIAALTESLAISVKIEYLDGSASADQELQSYLCNGDISASTNAKDKLPLLCLLYRPGHYDILYPRT